MILDSFKFSSQQFFENQIQDPPIEFMLQKYSIKVSFFKIIETIISLKLDWKFEFINRPAECLCK